MNKKEEVAQLKQELHELCDKMSALVNEKMANKGNKEEFCQRLSLLNRIFDVEKYINGIKEEDLK